MRHFTRRISRARFRTLQSKDRDKYKQFCRDRFGKLNFIDEQTGLTDEEGASGQRDRATTPPPAALAVQAEPAPASASECGTMAVGQRPATQPVGAYLSRAPNNSDARPPPKRARLSPPEPHPRTALPRPPTPPMPSLSDSADSWIAWGRSHLSWIENVPPGGWSGATRDWCRA